MFAFFPHFWESSFISLSVMFCISFLYYLTSIPFSYFFHTFSLLFKFLYSCYIFYWPWCEEGFNENIFCSKAFVIFRTSSLPTRLYIAVCFRFFSRNIRMYLLFVTCLTWYIFARFGGVHLNAGNLSADGDGVNANLSHQFCQQPR